MEQGRSTQQHAVSVHEKIHHGDIDSKDTQKSFIEQPSEKEDASPKLQEAFTIAGEEVTEAEARKQMEEGLSFLAENMLEVQTHFRTVRRNLIAFDEIKDRKMEHNDNSEDDFIEPIEPIWNIFLYKLDSLVSQSQEVAMEAFLYINGVLDITDSEDSGISGTPLLEVTKAIQDAGQLQIHSDVLTRDFDKLSSNIGAFKAVMKMVIIRRASQENLKIMTEATEGEINEIVVRLTIVRNFWKCCCKDAESQRSVLESIQKSTSRRAMTIRIRIAKLLYKALANNMEIYCTQMALVGEELQETMKE